jgi:hypothetical protein
LQFVKPCFYDLCSKIWKCIILIYKFMII